MFILTSLIILLFFTSSLLAQEPAKSELQQRAEAANAKNDIALARSSFIRAYEDYARKGQWQQAVECGAKGTALYYKENFYKEAFDLLRRVDQSIIGAQLSDSRKEALHYLTTKERLQMYMKLRKAPSAMEQLATLERHAAASADEKVKNDLLYTKAICYYTFGQNDRGNAVFKEMVGKLTAVKEYAKVDEVYQTLIANGRRSGNATMVAQAYSNYIAWKDSASALRHADEIGALKLQIQQRQADIQERDDSLAARKRVIAALGTLLAVLAVALVLAILVLLRFIVITRKQKKTIRRAEENIALKASFISNISAQMAPTLQKLDSHLPEVKALQDFSDHVQMLSTLEQQTEAPLELEDTPMATFCEELVNSVRPKVRSGVILKMDVPHMSAPIYRPYVTHILQHLLQNAATYAPEGATVRLDFKKRGPHKLQFLVANTGSTIPEEKREDVFKPFVEVHDLTQGDGLGLPICRQMALRMNGELNIDPSFTRGTCFVLDLQV